METMVLKGKVLNTEVYRGYASMQDLARVSAPDTYNLDTNQDGLQRDLSEKHAREGYRYAEGSQQVPEHPRLWPEVVLNVRDASVIELTPLRENSVYELVVREELINKEAHSRPQISRTDGNHRLFFAEGHPRMEWPPLDVQTSFALVVGLTPDQEAFLFMDINDEQRAMNTSHLAHLRARLTPSEELAAEKPALWIAENLADDPRSPFHGMVYKGGERRRGEARRRVNLTALTTGAEMILAESVKLRSLSDIYARYALIRLYWSAVKDVYRQEWEPRQYLVLRGIGIWTFSLLGGEIIDRCLVRNLEASKLYDEMVDYLRQTYVIHDWDRQNGTVSGRFGGRTGAKNAAALMKSALSDEDINLDRLSRDLKEGILQENL